MQLQTKYAPSRDTHDNAMFGRQIVEHILFETPQHEGFHNTLGALYLGLQEL